jgi:hypothetical protein
MVAALKAKGRRSSRPRCPLTFRARRTGATRPGVDWRIEIDQRALPV